MFTVDEQRVAFRGRFTAKQYISRKEAHYGIKVWSLCDDDTSYGVKVRIYPGKKKGTPQERYPSVVCDLTREIEGHNLEFDNFFTQYHLGKLLLDRKYNNDGD